MDPLELDKETIVISDMPDVDEGGEVQAQMRSLADSLKSVLAGFEILQELVNKHEKKNSEQFGELKSSVEYAVDIAKVNTDSLSEVLEIHRSETHRELSDVIVKLDAVGSRITLYEIAEKKESMDDMNRRMAGAERSLDNIQATLSELVSTKGSSKSPLAEDFITYPSFTPHHYSTSYPTSTPTRGPTTPTAQSHDERRLSPPNQPMETDSVFRMSELVAQSVADKLAEQSREATDRLEGIFGPIDKHLREVVKSAKKSSKEKYKTPGTSKPTAKKKGKFGDSDPSGSSSSSASDSDNDPFGHDDIPSDSESNKSDSTISILRGMEYSTRKKHHKSRGEGRRMSTLTPPVMKKTREGNSPTIMYVKAETPANALQLSKLSVEAVTWFVNAFNDMDANTTEDLKMSKFIHTRIRDRMVMYAERAGLPGADGMVDRGRHLLDNNEVFTLLAYCVTPTTKMEMIEELKKPLFTAVEQKRTKDELGIVVRPSDYKDYYDHMDEYKRRFIKRLDLFDEFGKKLLPREVFSKHDEWGMADYFIFGMLYRKLGKSIWQGVETSKKAKAAKAFDKYLDYFFERLKVLKRDAERIEVFNKTMTGAAAERQHSDRGEYETDQPKQRGNFGRSARSNHMSRIEEEYEDSAPEDDDDGQYDGVIDFDLDDYEPGQVNNDEEDFLLGDEEDDRKPSADADTGDDSALEESTGLRADGTLLTVQEKRMLTDDEKSKLVCFKYYNTGECTVTGCKFSHDSQLATKKLLEDMARLTASRFNPNRTPTPPKKPHQGPRVSWPEDVVRQSANPKVNGSGGRGARTGRSDGGRGTSPRILKRG